MLVTYSPPRAQEALSMTFHLCFFFFSILFPLPLGHGFLEPGIDCLMGRGLLVALSLLGRSDPRVRV